MGEVNRIKELVKILNQASKSYYIDNNPTMSDREYDKLYDELKTLENDVGIAFSVSPTQKVGSEIKKDIKKVVHKYSLLSLDKTKKVAKILEFAKCRTIVAMIKCDGLTTDLEYKINKLSLGATRGNGEVGEDITSNVKMYQNIPMNIKANNKTINITGESIIYKKDFEEINSRITNEEDRFKTQRNLASGSIRVLDTSITKKRKINFLLFGIQGLEFATKEEQLKHGKQLGFDVAPYRVVNPSEFNKLESTMQDLVSEARERGIPYDGLVFTYNDLAYGESLGRTTKFPKHSMAFKFEDETQETILREIEYEPSRNGTLTPVAIFDDVELDGTSVTRASLHNLNILRSLRLGLGDSITVYKANQIIPQVFENLTQSNTCEIPKHCPVCGEELNIITSIDSGVSVLKCENSNCAIQLVKKIDHFCSKSGANIKNLSIKTIETLIKIGILTNVQSLFDLKNKEHLIRRIQGFGSRKAKIIVDSIEKAKDIKLNNFIYALGIEDVGEGTAKKLCKGRNLDELMSMNILDLMRIEDMGEVVSNSFYKFMQENRDSVLEIASHFNFEETKAPTSNVLDGMVFVITGSLVNFTRNSLKEVIENLGGKVSGSVSKNTSYLINNDKESTSSKNKKAKDLDVGIINEEEFTNKFLK